MAPERKEQLKNSVISYLTYIIEGDFGQDFDGHNVYVYKKKGLSEDFITEIEIDFISDQKNQTEEFSRMYIDYFMSTHEEKIANLMIQSNVYSEKIAKLASFVGKTSIVRWLLYRSNFNFSFYSSVDELDTYLRRSDTLEYLIEWSVKDSKTDSSEFKRFIIYTFSTYPNVIRHEDVTISKYFEDFDKVLQRFFIFKTNFIYELTQSGIKRIIELLENLGEDKFNEIVIKKIVSESKVLEWVDMQGDDEDRAYALGQLIKFYKSLSDNTKTILFKDEKTFYNFILNKVNAYGIIFDFIGLINNTKLFTEEITNKFFKYNPTFINLVNDIPNNGDVLVELKYGDNFVPQEVKDQINLPMVETVEFSSSQVVDMLWDHEDSPASWVQAYIDEELWEETTHWSYDGVAIPFDEINERSVNIIKEYFEKIGLEYDEGDLESKMMENSEIEDILEIATWDGHRSGDENELLHDIEGVLNQLFGDGNWERSKHGIKSTVSLIGYDRTLITGAYNDCGNWNVSCIWHTLKSEYVDRRDKPSLPEYRYGINGDFDSETFNERIYEDVSALISLLR